MRREGHAVGVDQRLDHEREKCGPAARDRGRRVEQRLLERDQIAEQPEQVKQRALRALVECFIPDAKPPLSAPAAHYVLIELATPRQGANPALLVGKPVYAAWK